jgi:hypothetical protein
MAPDDFRADSRAAATGRAASSEQTQPEAPWWARAYVRLGLLLTVLAASVLALLAVRVGLFDLGSGPAQARGAAFAAGCPGREAPQARRVPAASVGALRGAVAHAAPARAARAYQSGTITIENLFSDDSPERQPASGSQARSVSAGYELRWWLLNRAGNEDDVAADVLEFTTKQTAENALARAASPRCRREATARAGQFPSGARDLRWVNPDNAREWDVLFTRGKRLYRIAYVPSDYPPATGPAQRAHESQRDEATAEALACALAGAACRAPGVHASSTNLATLAASPARSSAARAPSRARAKAYAHAVNLRGYDVPAMVEAAREVPTGGRALSDAFSRCTGDARPTRSLGDFNSPLFSSRNRRQDAVVASTVAVLPSEAAADGYLDQLATDRARACVRRGYERTWLDRVGARRQLRVIRISATPLPDPAPASYRGLRPYVGAAIRVTIDVSARTRRGARVQTPIYIDELAFASGRAVIALAAESVAYPFSNASERYLIAKLVGRAQVNEA